MPEELVSIKVAAKEIGVTSQTLRRWAERGLLRPAYVSPGGHRRYRLSEIKLFMNDIFAVAEDWAASAVAAEPVADFYCRHQAILQARLETMQTQMGRLADIATIASLLQAIAGEIGNNAYDHNLGNWPDVPGVFLHYSLDKRQIILADRGRGVLATLSVVRPGLATHAEALRVAFSEVLTARAPELRGNGLKFVRKVILKYAPSSSPISILFRSGDAELTLATGDADVTIKTASRPVRGSLAVIQF